MTVDLRTAAELGRPACGARISTRGRCDLPYDHPIPLAPGWDHAESIGRGAVTQLAGELADIPGTREARLELANIRRLVERHGIAPADGNGEIRSTVAMVEEALVRRPAVD